MAAFKDQQGRDWILEVVPPVIAAVRRECDVDLVNLERIGELSDPVKLVDVLYIMCRQQCEQRQIDAEQFGRSIAGESYQNAADALLAAIADFFPPRKRSQLRSLWEKQAAIAAEMDADLEARMPEAMATVERMMREELEKRLTRWNSATDAPAS